LKSLAAIFKWNVQVKARAIPNKAKTTPWGGLVNNKSSFRMRFLNAQVQISLVDGAFDKQPDPLKDLSRFLAHMKNSS
jgi:hypothetical protein